MRRSFFDQGKRSRRGICRYQRIKLMNEQKHAWLVMKYQFSCDGEYRVPIYRVRRERAYREYFRIRLSGRAVEEVFQFHKPFRSKSAFRMSAYRPKNVLVETAVEVAGTDV
jgi:hypothetical protein